MTYKYRLTYNRETDAYAYPDFDFEFRTNDPAHNAPKVLCKLIEEHVWLRIPLPTPLETEGVLVTVEITWSPDAGTLHERGLLGGLRRIGAARDAARFAALDSCKMDADELDAMLDEDDVGETLQAQADAVNGNIVVRWMLERAYTEGKQGLAWCTECRRDVKPITNWEQMHDDGVDHIGKQARCPICGALLWMPEYNDYNLDARQTCTQNPESGKK